MQRRRFLIAGGWSGAVLLFPGAGWGAAQPRSAEGPWAVIAATMARLLPEDGDGPGADSLHAAAYLRRTLDGPRVPGEDSDFLLQGAGWLDDAARQEAGAPFTALAPAEQDAVLTTIGRSAAGERWLSRLLDFVLEALLADPVYGANPDGRGWRWLNHRPGFPRPPADKTYRALAERWRA